MPTGGEPTDASHTREEEADHSYLMQRRLDPNLPSSSGSPAGGSSPAGGGVSATRNAILREEDLSVEDRAIMEACENDETWQTIKRMRGNAKEKFLTCLCVLIQEVVEEPACAARFRGWTWRWGKMSCTSTPILPLATTRHGDYRGAVCLGAT